MSIKVQTEFTRKETVRIVCYVYNDDEELAAVDSVAISIKDPIGEVVIDGADTNMTPTATGVYEYYYETDEANEKGDYQVECDVKNGDYHSFAHSHFNLTAGINEA